MFALILAVRLCLSFKKKYIIFVIDKTRSEKLTGVLRFYFLLNQVVFQFSGKSPMRNLGIQMVTCLALLGSASGAQSLKQEFQENPLNIQKNSELFGEIPKSLGGEFSIKGSQGFPSAQPSRAPNSDDLREDQSIIFQNGIRSDPETSNLKRYFSILSGQILPIYGATEFSQTQNNDLLFFNVVGRDYRLGPGDIVRVSLRGFEEQDLSLKVLNNGMLFINSVSPINVSGKTIAELEAQVLSILKLDDASASVFISLETGRLVTVQVSGGVLEPKTIAVPAYTPISRVLSYAGGISDTGSLRNIALQHQGGRVENVDFYNFLQNPFGGNDPLIIDNARIFVGNKNATIAASGYVARPGIYELPENSTSTSIINLLKMSGTTLIPPGAIVEILSFNEFGISQAVATTLDQNINQGEALRIRFVETRDLANITVKGAVLESFDFASAVPISIKDILKNGSVLKQNALLSFAMIDGGDGESKAINIADALKNPSIKVFPGSTLHIFDQNDFNKFIIADPNKTNDPLVAKILQTEIAEIYLNGRRIAFVPPSSEKSFRELTKSFYGFSPETVLDFALVQKTNNGNAISSAVSVRNLLQDDAAFRLRAGTKIFLFERAFYSKILKRTDGSNSNLENSISVELNVVGEALNDANVVSIILDGEAFALLPSEQPQTLQNILDLLGGLPVSISNDLAILSFFDANQEPEAVTLADAVKTSLVGDVRVDLFTENGLRAIIDEIERGRNDTLALNIKTYANKIFIDGQMIAAFGQFKKLSNTSFSDILRGDSTIYPIFSTVSEYNSVSGTWDRETFTLKQLLNEHLETDVGARFDLLTKPFVAAVLENTSESELIIGFADDGSISDTVTNNNNNNNTNENLRTDDKEIADTTAEKTIGKTLSISDVINTKSPSANNLTRSSETKVLKTLKRLPPSLTLEALQNASRFVGGGVERPGSYPTAAKVSLKELLQIAGGFTPGADIENIIVQAYEVGAGKLRASAPRFINGTQVNLEQVILSGQFSVNVQTFINDAFSGSIILLGEVSRPGEYIFSRSETLHDVLERASGFSDAAYPLGAVFERKSAKEEQKSSNIILAEKIEQSVLQLATSDMQGAGDQINAVLGFANQLKEQEPVGRLSVNVLMRNQSSPVYLEDGDQLFIPKRPSHVSVIGSVSQSVKANYSPQKKNADYIANAGGYSRIADKNRAYMLLPNGEAKPLSNSTIIPPGSVLIIPPKTDKLSILGLTDVISRVLGNIATSILAINNVN